MSKKSSKFYLRKQWATVITLLGYIVSCWIFDSSTFNIHNIWNNKIHSQLRFLTDSKSSLLVTPIKGERFWRVSRFASLSQKNGFVFVE